MESKVANTTPAAQYQRASTFAKGIGDNLDAIQNRDVVLRDYSVSERPMRGETATFVSLEISEVDGDEVKTYHAWSDSLAQKVNEIPKNALPLLIKFQRVNTSAGFRVWTFE